MQHIPRKCFGQNFLHDQAVIYQIIAAINPQPGQIIIEIGPGLAALTAPLVAKLGQLQVIEIDRDIIRQLQQKFNSSQLTIHEGDALKFDFSQAQQQIRVIGNLPYNISTPLLFHLSNFANISNMVFMLQQEVVDRICASPGSKAYGKLSIMLQYQFKCYSLLQVPPHSFYPVPKVNSAVIELRPRSDYAWQQVKRTNLNTVVAAAFNGRRKTIANSLKNLITPAQFTALDIDPRLRAENLTVAQYLALSKLLET